MLCLRDSSSFFFLPNVGEDQKKVPTIKERGSKKRQSTEPWHCAVLGTSANRSAIADSRFWFADLRTDFLPQTFADLR